jgi:hypothetical protein
MTQTHPITPPLELVQQWRDSAHHAPGGFTVYIATQAAQWGADQELGACCELLPGLTGYLRGTRRPKPPSLKEQALEALEALPTPAGQVTADRLATIRRALEALND